VNEVGKFSCVAERGGEPGKGAEPDRVGVALGVRAVFGDGLGELASLVGFAACRGGHGGEECPGDAGEQVRVGVEDAVQEWDVCVVDGGEGMLGCDVPVGDDLVDLVVGERAGELQDGEMQARGGRVCPGEQCLDFGRAQLAAMRIEEVPGVRPGGSCDPPVEQLTYFVVAPSTVQDGVKAFGIDMAEEVGEVVDGRGLGEESCGQFQVMAEVRLLEPVSMCVEECFRAWPIGGLGPLVEKCQDVVG